MRWRELRLRASVALRRRVPGGRAAQRLLVREDMRDLRRLTPVSEAFGFDRGTPIDRWYIDRFLEDHRATISGRILEVGDRRYTDAFGTAARTVDVLELQPGRGVTVVADLESGDGVPAESYDCVIATQVLSFTFDLASVARHLHRALAPGGTALVTVPGISPVSDYDDARSGDYWRLTERSLTRIFEGAFGAGSVDCRTYGNVLAASAFLYGLAAEDLESAELVAHDPRYPVLVAVSAHRA